MSGVPTHVGLEPPDVQREREGVVVLQQLELKVDHSVRSRQYFIFVYLLKCI